MTGKNEDRMACDSIPAQLIGEKNGEGTDTLYADVPLNYLQKATTVQAKTAPDYF